MFLVAANLYECCKVLKQKNRRIIRKGENISVVAEELSKCSERDCLRKTDDQKNGKKKACDMEETPRTE